jgi:NADH-quinone oxidoreductase subunit G
VPKLPKTPKAEMAGYPIKDFYLTNAICRASPTMHQCSAEILHGADMLEAAE